MNDNFQFLVYRTAEENVSVDAIIRDETIWLTQKSIARLFDVDIPAISKHLSNIYSEGELTRESTVSKMEIVQQEGTRKVKREQYIYNLDAIISVGYRVNSRRATQFRIWATGVLKEYKKSLESTYFRVKLRAFEAFSIMDQTGVEPVSENEFPLLLLS